MAQELQGGVLIIGSLFWENEHNAIEIEKGILRAKWREVELDMTKAVIVSCPIRYGRKSVSRRYTYTMLFSNSVPVQGTAILVPFKKTVSPEDNFKAISDQAQYLALIEGIRKKEEFNTHKNWGMVALKIMPQLNKKNKTTADQLEKWWTDMHSGLIKQNEYRIDGSEDPSVTADGFLNCNFSPLTDEVQLDYILATPVVPGLAEYPSAWQIAEAIKSSNPQYSTYFVENYKNRIHTFQDEDIRLLLEETLQIPQTAKHSLQIENYRPNLEGYYQFQHDILKKLGDTAFIPSPEVVCFHALKAFNYPFKEHGIHAEELQSGCSHVLEQIKKHFELFPSDGKMDFYETFLFHSIGVEKLPGLEKDRIESMVKEDLKKRRKLIEKYEREDYIKEFKTNHILPRNHNEKILHDFYLRNIQEEQVIINYLLNGLEQRAIYNCKMKLFGTHEYFDWYHDRPYTSSIPNTEDYFDHTKIDLCGNKLGGVKVQRGRELETIYYQYKKEFYTQLSADFEPEHVFHEIDFFLSYLPAASAQRKPVFEELITDFKEKKWYSFYALGLAQIEGLFSEMSSSIDARSRKPSLPEKVQAVRPAYEFAHSSFDYYQYHIPLLRNKFMHFGLEEDIEVKCYDVLYDLRHLLEVYIDLKTPLLELNKLMKKGSPSDFHDAQGYNYYFDLLDAIKKASQYNAVQKDVESFEQEFLTKHTDIEYLASELNTLVPQAINHWYDTIAVFTELNTSILDLKALTNHQLNKNSAEYVERIKPVFKAHENMFTNLQNYHNFLRRSSDYLPSLPPEVNKQFQKLYNDHKADFEKLLFLVSRLSIQ